MDQPKSNLLAGIALLVAGISLGISIALLTPRRGDESKESKELSERINTLVKERFDAEKTRVVAETAAVSGEKGFKAPPEKIKKLLLEILATQKQARESAHISYDRGLKSADDVLISERAVLTTQLDLCGSVDERMHVYDEMLRVLAAFEKLVEAREQAGQVTKLDVFLAKNERLLTEISMEREKVGYTGATRLDVAK